jgi:hypothetical protein
VKYYLYISDAKVEMLGGQLRRGLGGIVAGWKVDVAAGPASIGAEGRSVDPNRYKQLERIARHIRKHEDCGTIDHPGAFVFDTLKVRWGPFSADDRIVFFSGVTQKTVFALGGSSPHLLQAPKPETAAYPHTGSATGILVRALLREFGHTDNPNYDAGAPKFDGALLAAVTMLGEDFERKNLGSPPTEVEFLAKTLLVGESYKGYYTWRMRKEYGEPDVAFPGSPLYVAMTR